MHWAMHTAKRTRLEAEGKWGDTVAVQMTRAETWGTGGNEQLQEVGPTGLRDGSHVGAKEPRRKGGGLLGQGELEAPVRHQEVHV